jgi:hypothetical protein
MAASPACVNSPKTILAYRHQTHLTTRLKPCWYGCIFVRFPPTPNNAGMAASPTSVHPQRTMLSCCICHLCPPALNKADMSASHTFIHPPQTIPP